MLIDIVNLHEKFQPSTPNSSRENLRFPLKVYYTNMQTVISHFRVASLLTDIIENHNKQTDKLNIFKQKTNWQAQKYIQAVISTLVSQKKSQFSNYRRCQEKRHTYQNFTFLWVSYTMFILFVNYMAKIKAAPWASRGSVLEGKIGKTA